MPKKQKKIKKKKFKMGDVVVWEPKNFNQDWWNELPEEDRLKYYGILGYGRDKPRLFVFITTINGFDEDEGCCIDTGHCILISLDDQSVETMRHTCEFRHATEEEF